MRVLGHERILFPFCYEDDNGNLYLLLFRRTKSILGTLYDSCRRLAAQQTMNSLRTPREDEIPSMQGEGRVRARIGRGGYKGSRLY